MLPSKGSVVRDSNVSSMAPKWTLRLCCLQSGLRSGKADSKDVCCEVAFGCFGGAKVGSKVGSEWDDARSKVGSVVQSKMSDMGSVARKWFQKSKGLESVLQIVRS